MLDDSHCSFDLRIIVGRGDHKLKSSGSYLLKKHEKSLEISSGIYFKSWGSFLLKKKKVGQDLNLASFFFCIMLARDPFSTLNYKILFLIINKRCIISDQFIMLWFLHVEREKMINMLEFLNKKFNRVLLLIFVNVIFIDWIGFLLSARH